MLNRCHECCYATLIENGTYQYYKCGIKEMIRNDMVKNEYMQLDGCKYFREDSEKILRNIFDSDYESIKLTETLIDK